MAEINLSNKQKRLININPDGLMILKGITGSGKTTVAVRRLETILKDTMESNGKISVGIFTNSLIEYLNQSFTNKDFFEMSEVDIKSVHQLYIDFLQFHNNYIVPEDNNFRENIFQPIYHKYEQVEPNSIIFSRDISFLLDEFTFIQNNICHYNPNKAKERKEEYHTYQNIVRSGQEIRNFQSHARQLTWQMYQEYYQKQCQLGRYDYPTFYYQALKFQEKLKLDNKLESPFKHLIIDKAQDLSRTQMRFLVNLWKSVENSNLLIISDMNLRTKQNDYTWKSVGLNAIGKSYILRQNHRNTIEIARAAAEIIKQSRELTVSDTFTDSEYISKHGPKPVLNHFKNNTEQDDNSGRERDYILKKINNLIESGQYEMGQMAIISPDYTYLEELGQYLEDYGHSIQFINSDKSLIETNSLSLLTMESMQGLEYPIIFLVGINQDWSNSKLLYNSMVRASQRLYISSSGESPSPLLSRNMIDYSLFAVDDGVKCRPYYDLSYARNDSDKLREWLISELTTTYGYDLKDIAIEKEVFLDKGHYGVANIIIEQSINGHKKPYIVAQIESNDLKSGKEELKDYLRTLDSVEYGILTDGHSLKVFEKYIDLEGKLYLTQLEDLPTYNQIIKEGLIDLPDENNRVIPLVDVDREDDSQSHYPVPVLGTSAAGEHFDTQENFFGQIYLPEKLAKDERIKAIKIQGDSMIDIGIEDNSIVLIKTGVNFRSGTIGVVTLSHDYDWGTLCKKIIKEKDQYRMKSLNSYQKYEDIVIKEDKFRYHGEVIAIYNQ